MTLFKTKIHQRAPAAQSWLSTDRGPKRAPAEKPKLEEGIMQNRAGSEVKSIVLVHGGFVDGSGWEGVYRILTRDGYRVRIVQNPTLSSTPQGA
jgi:hypothetical protein